MLNIENQNKQNYYLDNFDRIVKFNKKLLFAKPNVSDKYIINTKKLFKRALIFYLLSGEKYDAKLFNEKSPNGTAYPKLSTTKFYQFKEIINNYKINSDQGVINGKEESNLKTTIYQLEQKIEFNEKSFNNRFNTAIQEKDKEIEYLQKKTSKEGIDYYKKQYDKILTEKQDRINELEKILTETKNKLEITEKTFKIDYDIDQEQLLNNKDMIIHLYNKLESIQYIQEDIQNIQEDIQNIQSIQDIPKQQQTYLKSNGNALGLEQNKKSFQNSIYCIPNSKKTTESPSGKSENTVKEESKEEIIDIKKIDGIPTKDSSDEEITNKETILFNEVEIDIIQVIDLNCETMNFEDSLELGVDNNVYVYKAKNDYIKAGTWNYHNISNKVENIEYYEMKDKTDKDGNVLTKDGKKSISVYIEPHDESRYYWLPKIYDEIEFNSEKAIFTTNKNIIRV